MKRILTVICGLLLALGINSVTNSDCHSMTQDRQSSQNSQTSNHMEQLLYITIGGSTHTATMVSNAATEALLARLKTSPVTVTLNSSGGFEIWGALGFSLPATDEPVNAQPGDIVLYNGSNICMFYGTNSWSYTRLGKIDGLSESELRTFLKAGESNVKVTLSLSNTAGLQSVDGSVAKSNASSYTLSGTSACAGQKGVCIKNKKKIIR